jgi:signal transduction histidine kinase
MKSESPKSTAPQSQIENPLAEQLVELSALTGGLAHEIRNPLSTMKVNLQLLDEDWRQIESPMASAPCDPQEVARRSRVRIANLLLETRRLERILGDFLQFVGKRELKLIDADLNGIVAELADFYRPQAQAHHVQFDVELSREPLNGRVDPQVLKQSLLNLLINAQQSISADRSGERGGANDRITMRTQQDGPGMARIDVIDTGPGIPAEISESIFRAYFSTKKGGTGLGLATARQIVREHGGSIEFDSPPEGGTRFTIRLPINA